MEQAKLTGYPSIDKPWLKYYSEEAINAPLPECTIYEYLWENNKDHLESIAINFFGSKLTYRELFRRIDETADAFHGIGVKPGDIVTVITISCVPSILCLYALNKIGAVINYLNVLASEDEISRFVTEAESSVVVSLDLFAEKVCRAIGQNKAIKHIVYSLADDMPLLTKMVFRQKTKKAIRFAREETSITVWGEFIKQETVSNSIYHKDASSPCYLAHTGGTTGIPKGVLLNDLAFNAVTQTYILSMPHKRGETFLSVMIPYVVYGTLINIHMPLCLGLETVIIPKFEPQNWATYIKKYNVNHCCAIPAYIAPMLDDRKLQKMDLSRLKTVGMGGEGMNIPLEKRLNAFFEQHYSKARVLMGYGLTETCATAVSAFENVRKEGSVGIPLPKNIVAVFNPETNTECRYLEKGEICIQSASRMIGYMDSHEEPSIIRKHADGSEWLHTGDIGYLDENGFLYIEGRMKRVIMTIMHGAVYKVFPFTVEQIINQQSDVLESCVVRMNRGADHLLKAYILKAKDADEKQLISDIKAACAQRLAGNAQPVEYEVIVEMPRTAAGKIDYRALEERAEKEA
ncbi:MAG: acyl--CoA ligase [Clostridia bacterium]|nr:acyl--CoA ligase [Clostridia bacterium]